MVKTSFAWLQKNFAFVVIETVADSEDKNRLLSLEQKYLDSLNPPVFTIY